MPEPLPKRLWMPWDTKISRVGFRRSLLLTGQTELDLAISCSGNYKFWVDGNEGALVQSHLPSWRCMHYYKISLPPGEHQFLAEAHDEDVRTPFFMACLIWRVGNEARYLVTDAEWEMTSQLDEEWGTMPQAQSWQPAWAFDGAWAEPWGMPCDAPEIFCGLSTGWQVIERQMLLKVASLYLGGAGLGSDLRIAENGSLIVHPPQPYPIALPVIAQKRPCLEWYRTREAHSLINNTWLDMFEARCPHVVHDVNGEVFARLKLTLISGGPAFLAVTTGESLGEVQRYDRRVTDLIQLHDGDSFTTAPTGFRFVKIMILSCQAESAQLAPIEVQQVTYPVRQSGTFECNDDCLNTVFNLSARTLQRCMQNEIWDGIKRDQLPWMGDLYTEALAAYHLFGDYRLARRTLAILGEIGPAPASPVTRQRYPGLTAIWKTTSNELNDIPAYTLWWLAGMYDYYLYSGEIGFLQELSVELEATLQHIASCVGKDGLWRMRAGWDFVDWAPLTPQQRAVYCHLLATQVMGLGVFLLKQINQPAEAYLDLQKAMRQAARVNWWQPKDESFSSAHHLASQAIRSGVLSGQEARLLFKKALAHDPPLSMTYWHRYLDLEAAQQVGAISWGLDYIRRHWGAALKLDTDTFWEAFDPTWLGEDPHAVSMIGAGYARYGGYETSLCHGWSAGPAIWLHRAVLGISPIKPGFRKVLFCPNLGNLDWVRGAIPTPMGLLRVSLGRGVGEELLAELQLPPGIQVAIPMKIRKHWRITGV